MGDVIRFPDRQRAPEPDRRSARRTAPGPAEGEQPLWRTAAGGVLRDERHRRGRTLSEVAGDAGISVQYLSEIERGLKEPSSEMLAAASGALGLSLADLTAEVSRRLRGPVCLAA